MKGNTELNTLPTEVTAMVNKTVSKSDAAGKNCLAIQKLIMCSKYITDITVC